MRWRVKTANRDITGDYRWIDESAMVTRSRTRDGTVVERLGWGDFHGHVRAVKQGDQTLESLEASFPVLQRLVAEKAKTRAEISALQKGELGELNRSIEQLRLAERRLALGARPEPERSRRAAAIAAESARLQTEYDALAARLGELRRSFESDSIVVETADGETRELLVGSVVRAIRPNALGLGGAIALYASRVREFVADDPRESNTEGGIFPAIFGTVLMVILMSLVVTPFGVVAAVYLHSTRRTDLWCVQFGSPSTISPACRRSYSAYSVSVLRVWDRRHDRPTLLRKRARRPPSAPAGSCGPV